MRFGIIGAGAIGCLFGARLKLAGHDVTLIHRDPTIVRRIRKQGVRLQEVDGTFGTVYLHVRGGPALIPGIEILIVAVKAYDTGGMASSYRGMLSPETTILSLQNGLGNIETLQSIFGKRILAGSTTEGALLIGPGSVRHSGKGLTVIGDPNERNPGSLDRIRVALNEAGFRTKVSSNIQGELWAKVIVNAAINPLSALTRLPNGRLSKNQGIREIATRVMDEAVLVSHARRIRLVGDPRRLWGRILLSTGANKSSMLQDIERGKTTEIRQLNGAIISHGKEARIKTPINEVLTGLVLGLEESSKLTM